MVGDSVQKGLSELSGTESAKTIEALKRIRLSATMLEVGFKSDNLSEVIQCQIELEGLAAQLEAEHGDLVTPEQCESAKGSLEGFVALVDRVFEQISRAAGSSPGAPGQKPPVPG